MVKKVVLLGLIFFLGNAVKADINYFPKIDKAQKDKSEKKETPKEKRVIPSHKDKELIEKAVDILPDTAPEYFGPVWKDPTIENARFFVEVNKERVQNLKKVTKVVAQAEFELIEKETRRIEKVLEEHNLTIILFFSESTKRGSSIVQHGEALIKNIDKVTVRGVSGDPINGKYSFGVIVDKKGLLHDRFKVQEPPVIAALNSKNEILYIGRGTTTYIELLSNLEDAIDEL